MTISLEPLTALFADYRSNKILSEDGLEQLAMHHSDLIDAISNGATVVAFDGRQFVHTGLAQAPSNVCDETDVPHGATWGEVVAAVLDAHQGTSNNTYELMRTAEEYDIQLVSARQAA